MLQEIHLADYNGDFSAFCEACYEAYLSFWKNEPCFEGKLLQRNKNKISNGKEDDFWGIVDGHGPNQSQSTERYGKVVFLSYLFDSQNSGMGQDVLFLKRIHKRKVRIEVFSKNKQYLVVLQEIGEQDRVQFITAHPLTAQQLRKKVKHYEDYCNNGKMPV